MLGLGLGRVGKLAATLLLQAEFAVTGCDISVLREPLPRSELAGV